MIDPHIFGIPGLTIGSVVISSVVAAFGSLGFVSWWVRGMADRRRASNEGVTADSKASEVQFSRLEKEIARLTASIERQDKVIKDQGERIDELERGLRECEHRHAEAIAENLRLRAINDGQGEVRGQMQRIASADRIERLMEGKDS